jgi:sentrin-specific protease 1
LPSGLELNCFRPQQTTFQTPLYDRSRITAQVKDAEIDGRLHPKFPSSLPPQDESQVDAFLRQRVVISKLDREQVADKDIARLRPSQWLNDEIINFYGALIQARSQEKENISARSGATNALGRGQPLNVHFFNTFFWTKLKGEGYEKGRLQKWTKKVSSSKTLIDSGLLG